MVITQHNGRRHVPDIDNPSPLTESLSATLSMNLSWNIKYSGTS